MVICMKQIMSFVLFFLLFIQIHGTLVYPPQEHAYTPDNTIILFDVDGVLVDRGFWQNAGAYWDIFWHSQHKWELAKAIFWLVAHYTEVVEHIYTKQSNDDFFDTVAQRWPVLHEKTANGQTILEQLKVAASHGIPRPEIQLLLQLHDHGYPIGIATNQGKKTFERLMNTRTIPDSSYYILIYTPDYYSTAYRYKKPEVEYFKDIQNILGDQGFKNYSYIFIDDKLENVQAAVQTGMLGVHVDNAISHPAQQLYKEIEELGLLRQSSSLLVPAHMPVTLPS